MAVFDRWQVPTVGRPDRDQGPWSHMEEARHDGDMRLHSSLATAIVGVVALVPISALVVASPAGAAGCAAGWSAIGSGTCRHVLVYNGSQPGDAVDVRGTVQTVVVPAGVTSISVVASGAAGARSASASFSGSPGGLGGRQSATVAVVPGDKLSVIVGEQGASVPQMPTLGWQVSDPGGGTTSVSGAFGGGGMTASNQAGFGGGGSFVFDGQQNADAPNGVGNLLVAAGGGGGGGYDYNTDGSYGTLYATGKNLGGSGGGASGTDGQSVGTLLASPPVCNDPAGAGYGAIPASAGAGGHSTISSGCNFGQADGTAGGGPAVLPDPAAPSAQNQFLGTGGSGVMGSPTFQWGGGYGGGGGGGFYGGGGGGTINGDLEGGGGGGGSGFAATGATGVASSAGVQHGDGQVVLTYSTSGGGAPAITSAASTTFTAGVPGTFTPTATGSPVPTLTESGTLPTGVTFSGGLLSGTPASGSAGSYPITFTASNGVGSPATQIFTLTVNTAPAITSFAPSSGPVGTTVVIKGVNLNGATTATFNGVQGTITYDTATKLKVKVPSGATTGKIKVVTPGGKVKTATAFTVT